jgi:hypothetical protein
MKKTCLCDVTKGIFEKKSIYKTCIDIYLKYFFDSVKEFKLGARFRKTSHYINPYLTN